MLEIQREFVFIQDHILCSELLQQIQRIQTADKKSENDAKKAKYVNSPFPKELEDDWFLGKSEWARLFWSYRHPKLVPFLPRDDILKEKLQVGVDRAQVLQQMMKVEFGDDDPNDHWEKINKLYTIIVKLQANNQMDEADTLKILALQLYKDGSI